MLNKQFVSEFEDKGIHFPPHLLCSYRYKYLHFILQTTHRHNDYRGALGDNGIEEAS